MVGHPCAGPMSSAEFLADDSGQPLISVSRIPDLVVQYLIENHGDDQKQDKDTHLLVQTADLAAR